MTHMVCCYSAPTGFQLFHNQGQLFDLRLHGQSLIGPFSLHFSFTGSHGQTINHASAKSPPTLPLLDSRSESVLFEFTEFAGIEFSMRFCFHNAGIEIVPLFVGRRSNEARHPLHLESFCLRAEKLELSRLAGLAKATDGTGHQPNSTGGSSWKFFPLGYNSFSPAYAKDVQTVQPLPRFPTAGTFNQYTDSVYWGKWSDLHTPWVATFKEKGRDNAVLIGWVSSLLGVGEVALRRRRPCQIEARLTLSGRTLAYEERLELDRLLVAADNGGQEVLDFWTDLTAQRMNARKVFTAPEAGWCSWYYYYTGISEAEVEKNLEILEQKCDRMPVRYVQIDDGYQSAVGDWLEPNAKFSHGLRTLAQSIKRRGFLPGIWTAPFLVQRNSRIFREHSEWLLRTHEGTLERVGYHPVWGVLSGQVYALDPTHPGTLTYLNTVFSELVQAGFEYFKIDFLFAGLRAGQHFDRHVSPVEAYRLGLEQIRHAVGERFILGCGAPLLPSIGLVDGMRISSDVKEIWQDKPIGWLSNGNGHPSAELAILNCLTRAHLHSRFWLNDPDCLLVRHRRSSLKEVEVQTLVTILSLTGGLLFLSDDLKELEPARARLAELALPPKGESARALGVLDEERPCRFVRRLRRPDGEEEALAAVINWADSVEGLQVKPSAFELDRRPWHVFEFWSSAYKKLEAGDAIPLTLDPHECALLLFRPVLDRPQVLTLTHHLGQTTTVLISEKWDALALEIQLELAAVRTGELWLAVPKAYQVQKVECGPNAKLLSQRAFAAGIIWTLEFRTTCCLRVDFIEGGTENRERGSRQGISLDGI